jgi:hypothetical protein
VDDSVDHGGGDGVLLEGQVADLVDDDQPVAAQAGELGGELAGAVGVGESGDPLSRGGEQDPVAVAAWSPKTPPQPLNGRLEVRMMEACS